ncbi:uncharacterized protein LOC124868558 [Girardinichthys multiradiatus]|uniref:uncharacterized protein LOC124868558 n=1 Tax=Girardinichthys multiradiatus TaxID=208333 RepID=UPI001FACDD61|nr:uncharacterized protein LOC124868558 [Girardinichthys multiradiatus]
MKVCLLLGLFVVALLPSLSESRIVSKCELKDKLGEEINLPKKLKSHDDEILSIIICEIFRRSNGNTSLVNVDGIRHPLATAQPTTGRSEPETTKTMAAASVSIRKKQRAPSRKSPDSQESLNDMENRFDEEQMQQDDERMSKEGSSDEDRSSYQQDPNKITLWSLGYYGVFQLRDSHFCDSGYRWSRNLCQKSCSDFTDDDITDDIECFINSNYHWFLFRTLSHECFNDRKTFLHDCS